MARVTHRQRMLAAYRNAPSADVCTGIYTRYLPRSEAEREARNNGMGVIDFYPAVSLLAPPWHTHAGYLSEVRGASLRIEHLWETDGPVEVRTYETPAGKVSQRIQRDPSYGSDWVGRHYVNGPDDYKALRYIVENTVFVPHHETVRQRLSDIGNDGVVLARLDRSPFQKLLVELADPQRFLMDVTTGESAALSLLEAIRERLTEQAGLAVDTPAQLVWQPDNVTADMTSPQFFKTYCLPFYQENATRFHERGKAYVVHMDGRLAPLKEMIAESGIDAVESFSLPDMGGDMSLHEAQKTWPGQAVLPNLPSAWCERGNTWITERLKGMLSERNPGRALMVQISEDIPTEHWQRACMLLARVAAELGEARDDVD